MPPKNKAPQSLDDILAGFADRATAASLHPNIHRLEPLPHQALFLQSQKQGRVLFGGNRAGKTHINVADGCLVLARKHPYRQHLYPEGPLRMRFIGVDFERGIDQGAIPKFMELLPSSLLRNGSWEDSYSRSDHMLTLADKSTVSFMSYEQDANKFQIVSLHHTMFDEEPPKAIFDEDMLRHVDVAGTWSLSETPVQQLEWVQDELIEPFEAHQKPDLDVFYLDTRDNINLPLDELRKLEASLSAADVIVRLAGKYKSGNMVFPEFERKYPFVIPGESFRLRADYHQVYESMDHGYVNPTAWNWTAVGPDGQLTVFKQLYAANIVVEDWAKAVLQARKEIARQYRLTDATFAGMLHGTFGDPAIADSGNAAAQTGITIQQAYALGGVMISTGNIRQARAANQNIGLDKFHTYLRLRPGMEVPWLQITDDCTALIDEVKRARKPRQSAKALETVNSSEQIRDKDNHAIDAQKYLFIATHDLRPTAEREVDTGEWQRAARQLEAVPTQFDTHQQIRNATMASDTSWTIHGSDSYFALEE